MNGWIPGVYGVIVPKAGEIVLSEVEDSGPDIWIDRQIGNAVFLSADLGDALNDTKAGEHLRLIECEVRSDSRGAE